MSLEKSDAPVTPTHGSPTTGLAPPSPLAPKTEALLYQSIPSPQPNILEDIEIDCEWADFLDFTQELLAPILSLPHPPAMIYETSIATPEMGPMEDCPSAPGTDQSQGPSLAVPHVQVPVLAPAGSSGAADEIWAEWQCVNPLEAEGVQTSVVEVTMTPPVPTPPKGKKLKLMIPPRESAPSPSLDTIDTAEVEAVLAEEAPQFDLLQFVTDVTLGPEDPTFLALAADTGPLVNAPTTSSQDLVTLDLTDLADPDYQPTPPVGKRPLKRSTPSRPRGRPPSAASSSRERLSNARSDHAYDASSVVSSEDAQEMKYRRMRDLNNEASKRCRQNRKRKFEALVDNEDELRKKNRQLRMRCQQLEDVVSQLKKRFIDRVANPIGQTSPPINLDRLVREALSPT